MKTILQGCLVACLVSFLFACSGFSNMFSGNDVGKVQHVEYGKIISMRRVQVKESSGVGTVVGAVAGAVIGSQIGGGHNANNAAAVGGAIAGGVAGHHIDKNINKKYVTEFVIRKENGGTIAITQANRHGMHVGQRVRIVHGSSQSQVMPE